MRVRGARWWRIVLAVLLAGGGLTWAATEPASAEAAPVYGDGYCQPGPPALTLVTCSDEAGQFLWSIKDPAFWHMAYSGITGLYATGGLLSGTDYFDDPTTGCTWTGPSDDDLYDDFTDEQWQSASETFGPCVDAVEEEAYRQARLLGYDVPSPDEQDLATLCNLLPSLSACQGLTDEPTLSAWLQTGPDSVNRNDFAAVRSMRTQQAFLHGFAFAEDAPRDVWIDVARWECTDCYDVTSETEYIGAVTFSAQIRTLAGSGFPITDMQLRMRYDRTEAAPEYNGEEIETHAWNGFDALYGYAWANWEGDDDSVRTDTDSSIGSGWRPAYSGTPSTHMWGGHIDVVDEESIISNVVRWWTFPPSTTAMDSLLVSMEDVKPGIVYDDGSAYPWPDPDLDNPGYVPPPEIDPPPDTDPDPEVDPSPTPTPNPGADPDESIWNLGNRIAGFFDNLASMIGSAFDWLGDIFGRWIRWLADQIWKIIGYLITALGNLLSQIAALLQWIAGLLQWMLSSLLDALGAMLAALGMLLSNIWSAVSPIAGAVIDTAAGIVAAIAALAQHIIDIPGAIVSGIGNFLHTWFVPVEYEAPEFECADIWPCSWVQEALDFFGGLGDIAGGAGGGCTAPGIGWDSFTVSVPPPSGCASASGSVAADSGNAGDLFGFRVAVRMASFLAFGLWFVQFVISLTPWAREKELRWHGQQQTLFDGFD